MVNMVAGGEKAPVFCSSTCDGPLLSRQLESALILVFLAFTPLELLAVDGRAGIYIQPARLLWMG